MHCPVFMCYCNQTRHTKPLLPPCMHCPMFMRYCNRTRHTKPLLPPCMHCPVFMRYCNRTRHAKPLLPPCMHCPVFMCYCNRTRHTKPLLHIAVWIMLPAFLSQSRWSAWTVIGSGTAPVPWVQAEQRDCEQIREGWKHGLD